MLRQCSSLMVWVLLCFLAFSCCKNICRLTPVSFRASPGIWRSIPAVSFVTNTNWQNYSGESAASYFSQVTGLAVQNFLSAATGMAIVIALIRGFVRRTAETIGNFWVDLTRTVVYIFLPVAFVAALVLVSQGVIQNFSPYKSVPLLQSTSYEKPKLDADGNAVQRRERTNR